MIKRVTFIILFLLSLYICDFAFAERDWEYWSQSSFSIPVNKTVTFLLLPEWRFKNDMHEHYSFKLETGPSFKVNDFLELTPYYVYQRKKSSGLWDRSDMVYLDGTVKLNLKNLFDLRLSNRLRYQYDFDKEKTTLRNAIKISKGFKVGKFEISPYFSEEPFYDTKLDRITEHRTSVGISCNLSRISLLG